jgi:serine/threonine protein kinase
MSYPSIDEYKESVARLSITAHFDLLKKGKAVSVDSLTNLPLTYSGGNAVVFDILLADNQKVALKCWRTDMKELTNRYNITSSFINQFKFFPNMLYEAEGIDVKGNLWPVAIIDWVEGDNLIEFIEKKFNFTKNHYNRKAIFEVADSFLKIVTTLHNNEISHGDLHHENIIILHDHEVKIIDLDDLFVPGLGQCEYLTIGKPGYQHTNRKKNIVKLARYTDYFSELVIFTSLLALVVKPELWKIYGQDDERLLFKESDFEQPGESKLFLELQNLSSPELNILVKNLWAFCEECDLSKLKPLESIVQQWPTTLEDFKQRYVRDIPISIAPWDASDLATSDSPVGETQPNTTKPVEAEKDSVNEVIRVIFWILVICICIWILSEVMK